MDAQQIGTNLNGPWLTFFSYFANSFPAKKSVAYLGHTNRSFELGQEKVKYAIWCIHFIDANVGSKNSPFAHNLFILLFIHRRSSLTYFVGIPKFSLKTI